MRDRFLQEQQANSLKTIIPPSLWQEEFFMLPTKEIFLQIVAQPEKAFEYDINQLTLREARQFWIITALANHNAPTQKLITLAKNLNLKDETMFSFAAALGRLDILETMKSQQPENLQDLILAYQFSAFKSAAANNQIAVLTWLAKHAPTYLTNMLTSGSFQNAAKFGDLDTLRWLYNKAPDDKLLDLLKQGFESAVERGNINTLNWFADGAESDLNELLTQNNYRAFHRYPKTNMLPVMQWIAEKLTPEHMDIMIMSGSPRSLRLRSDCFNFDAAFNAANHGELAALQWLTENCITPALMIATEHYRVFHIAVIQGHFSVFEWLTRQLPNTDEVVKMLSHANYNVLRAAIANGRTEILEWCNTNYPDVLQGMLQNGKFIPDPFTTNLRTLHWLESKYSNRLGDLLMMCQSEDQLANLFIKQPSDNTIDDSNNRLETIKRVAKYLPQAVINNLIKKNMKDFTTRIALKQDFPIAIPVLEWMAANYNAWPFSELINIKIISNAALSDRNTLEWFAKLAPDEFKNFLISSSLNHSIKQIAQAGDLETIKWLIPQLPKETKEPLLQEFEFFSYAVKNGNLDVANWLSTEFPTVKVTGFTDANNLAASSFFIHIANSGYTHVLRFIAEKQPHIIEHIGINLPLNHPPQTYYNMCLNAVNFNHLDTLNWLIALRPNVKSSMISFDDYQIFKAAVTKKYPAIINYCLSDPKCFAYAEMQMDQESQACVLKFIGEKVNKLKQQHATMQLNPQEFDVNNEEEVKLLFYMIKNLIRRKHPRFNTVITDLLKIPAVRNIAHQDITDGTFENELLRFANQIENEDAARILLTIPAVNQAAQENDFYANQSDPELSMTEIVGDDES